MSEYEANSYGEAELVTEFDQLFPDGFAGADVQHELAPDGWVNSPLLAVFHPSPAQLYEEACRHHRNLASLRRPNEQRPLPSEPTLDEVTREFREHPVEVEREIRELVGQCLWDVFSDGHEMVGPDGRVLDLGSFRASGGFLADLLNRQSDAEQYDYMNFYMGTIWVAHQADLTPVYRMIFRRLRSRGHDWIYHFPKLHAIDMRALKEMLERKDEPEWLNYSPSEALAKEEEDKKRDRELAEFRDSLEAGHREAVEESLKAPPPATVQAYEMIYSRLPRGWPPSV